MPTMIDEKVYNMYMNSTSTGNIGSTSIADSNVDIGNTINTIIKEYAADWKIKEGNMNKVEYNAMFKRAKIKNVIFNDPATIVFWSDGTKTVVKCGENDIYDPEKGLAMAVAKKYLGTNKSHSNYMDEFKKWLPKDEWHPDPFEDFIDSIKKLDVIGKSLKEGEHD